MNASRPGDGATGDEGTGAIVPREGSTLYYSLLWTTPETRARILARLALVETLARTLDDVQDRGVAERKVHWWHEELERLRAGEPRHPRAVACTDSLAGLDATGAEAANAALLDVLSVAATTRYTPPADDAERRERLVRDHGARLALLAHASSGRAEELVDPTVRHPELAFGLGLHATLARLPSLLHRGQAVFSDADYARHGETPAGLARHVRRSADDGTSAGAPDGTDGPGGTGDPGARAVSGNTLGGIPVVAEAPGRHALVAASVEAARAALDAALADADYRRTYSRPGLGPIARLAALRARQLRLWEERRPDLLRETVTPTPLAKLFVAWRHRHGARG